MRRLSALLALLAFTLGPGAAQAIGEDPPAGSFSPTGSLSEARAWHGAILAPDGRVFVVGGEGDIGPEGMPCRFTVEAWDPATGSFGAAGSHEWCLGWRPALPLADGHVLVLGAAVVGYPVSAEIWNPETGSFSFAGTVEAAHPGGSRTLLDDGRVLIVGGWSLAGWPDTALLWDPATSSFRPAGSLAGGARIHHTATRLTDGRVLVIGGIDREGEPMASVEMWDPATESFSAAGSLSEGRGGQPAHTATLLRDGRVLVVGGSDWDGTLASTEVWDPVSASFSPAGSLVQAREDHTATLLPDGRVLVIGGRNREDEFFASAEIWEPNDG